MAQIATIDLSEVLGALPEIVPFDRNVLANGAFDLLVCCAGFEERSTRIVQDIQDCRIRTLVVVNYATNTADNAKAAIDLQSLNCTDGRVEVSYKRNEFVSTLRAEFAKLRGRSPLRVAVDLSGMASFVVYRVLGTLFEELPEAELGVYYAEALDYAPARQEWETFFQGITAPHDNLSIAEKYEQSHFQSRGVDFTYESDVFPGHNVGPLATEVVAIPSFSLQRMKSMLCHVESQYNVRDDNVRWFLGQPPDRVRNGWRSDALAALYNVRQHGVPVSTRDYKDILQRLGRRWEEIYADRHLIIATLGSKMQHVGCFLFLTMHAECGLLLCEPKEFIAEKFSAGVGPRWWLEFGKIQNVKDVLSSRGKLLFHWPP